MEQEEASATEEAHDNAKEKEAERKMRTEAQKSNKSENVSS
jgi:hypothetical protein